MKDGPSNDRTVGWILAGLLFLHLLLLRSSSPIILASALLIMAGALLRSRHIHAPAWLERGLFLLGLAVVFSLRRGADPEQLVGEMGGLAGAVFLLRPLTPARGMRVIFCLLAMLIACVLRTYSGISATFLVLDVVVLMVLAQQVHRPPEAARSFWASLLRSLRVVVPVSIVVTLVFWLFPDLSLQTPAITGFAASGVLNPGGVAKLSQSHRVALVAKFSESDQIPPPDQLYWRGQILEQNEGLRWTVDRGRSSRRAESLQSFLPKGVPVWRYSQSMSANRGRAIPVLDRVITVDAWRGGQEVAVLDLGGWVLNSVGTGALRLEVTAAPAPANDPPDPEIADGALAVPDKIFKDLEIRDLTTRILPPGLTAPEALQAVAEYLESNHYAYTMTPGRIWDMKVFLLKIRRGFCEHYAAATANLLRLGGIPARIVVGYHGGEWNPWLRTVTVRDSDAHAWVEAWDNSSRQWLRFDPTVSVAPDLNDRMNREFNSATWPWYRLAFSAVVAFFTAIGDRISQLFLEAGSSELWESLQPVFFTGLLLFLTAWLARRIILRRRKASQDIASSLLDDLNKRAARLGRQRQAGETPLAWMARLQQSAAGPEKEILARFARAYEAGVYSADGLTVTVSNDLRASARHLKKIWKSASR
jgi:transglutaminase-like putative cysteine protease